ncbi:MAG TPA: ABC transporter permease [Thermomicrobiales bacterium]|nr:ABC transporter permease [Thermomicrobiales bacterium]
MTENRFRPRSLDSAAVGRTLITVGNSALAVLLALAVGAIFILISNQNPLDAYEALLKGAFGSRKAVAETLVASTPLIFGGLGFAIAFRASMFNIGIEGQLIVGSLAAGLIGAANWGLSPWLYAPLAMMIGGIAGGVWGAIPGLLKARSGASEVITTIMFNYLAFRLSTYMVTSAGNWLSLVDPQQKATNKVSPDSRLPIILDKTRLHAGFLVAIAISFLMWYLLFRTTFGYKIRTVGLSRGAADYAGIAWGATITKAMFISGFLGGLAGASETLGLLGRHYDNRAGYGFTAIAVGLVGRNNPIGVIFAGLLFGTLKSGSNAMQANAGTSKELVLILQALVILAISALASLEYLRTRRARIMAARVPPSPTAPTGVVT